MASLLKQLSLVSPIIAAPLGGGPTTPELVAAVCNAGGLGSLAAAYLSPEQIDQAVAKTRSLTSKPFVINLFTPMPDLTLTPAAISKAIAATHASREALGLPDPVLAPPYHPDFDAQFERVLRAKPAVFSFIFGTLDRDYLTACQQLGIFTMGTATTLEEARLLEENGVDAVVVQGVEAGGHRALFSPANEDPDIPVRQLTQLCSAALKIPVIAAGGIMTGHDIAAVLAAGAEAAMLGTAFLLCPEAATAAPYRQALLEHKTHPNTRLTRVFSGRLARSLGNWFILEMEKQPDAILPFPAQNAFTRDIRNQSTRLGAADYLSLWSGMGLSQIRTLPAGELVRALLNELENH